MTIAPAEAAQFAPPKLPAVLIPLSKGVVHRDDDPARWELRRHTPARKAAVPADESACGYRG